MQTHCRQRGEGVKKGPKTAYILKERPLTQTIFCPLRFYLENLYLTTLEQPRRNFKERARANIMRVVAFL